MSWSSSATSCFSESRVLGSAFSPSSAAATAMRASGVRSSWLALASSRRCAVTSSSMRCAERLKLSASAATSSRPSTFTRAPRSPPPSRSTPARSRSSRRPRPRTTGKAPTATAMATSAERGGDPEDRVGPLAHLARHQPAAVGKLQGEVGPAGSAPPAGAGALEVEARRHLAGHGDHVAVGAVEGDVEAQLALQRLDRALLFGPGRARHRAAARR